MDDYIINVKSEKSQMIYIYIMKNQIPCKHVKNIET